MIECGEEREGLGGKFGVGRGIAHQCKVAGCFVKVLVIVSPQSLPLACC